jgi:hypothetical protein
LNGAIIGEGAVVDIDDPAKENGVKLEGVPDKAEAHFDEEIYLRLNPDVKLAVASGTFRSGRDHYERYGRKENRPFRMPGEMVRDRILMIGNAGAAREKPKATSAAVDASCCAPRGSRISLLKSTAIIFSSPRWSAARRLKRF